MASLIYPCIPLTSEEQESHRTSSNVITVGNMCCSTLSPCSDTTGQQQGRGYTAMQCRQRYCCSEVAMAARKNFHWRSACNQPLPSCMQALPVWMPRQINEIEDPAALAMAARMQRTTIQVPAIGPVDTVFVGPGVMRTCAVSQL